jgi:hypothetical protein
MRLTMKDRKKVTQAVAERYRRAKKKQRGVILDEFVELTGYRRPYAAYVLRMHGMEKRLSNRVIIKASCRTGHSRRIRPRVYDGLVRQSLVKLWMIMDYICGKRLVAVLSIVIPKLEEFGEIELAPEVRQKLYQISASTIDRILAPQREKLQLKGKSHTKPGTLLKSQIPIRTFSEWNEQKPGFVEIDLVGHDGGNSHGEFIQTLDVTDICTTWTETQAVLNKAQCWVFDALKDIRKRLPFDLFGIDSDNGAEFINHHMVKYCQDEKLSFTRSRSYRKNDSCYVEQKNYSIVRRAVGYMRLEGHEQLAVLNELYRHLRLYTNFFQPTMKLVEKTRIGSKVIKRYDKPQTPYQRVLASADVPEDRKELLREEFAKLNPAELKRTITKLQGRLIKLSAANQPKAAV